MANEITKKENSLVDVSKSKVNMVIQRLKANQIELSQEQIKCGIALSSSIMALLQNTGMNINDIEQNSLNDALQKSILLELNANASPNECYVQMRNYKKPDGNWGKKIEFGIEGSGHEKLLKKFGIDVEALGQVWKVREDDEWTPPTYNGFEPTPPKWIPKGKGKIIRIVYPIKKNSGVIEYHIAEREDVLPNLIAHIRQNMMKEKDNDDKKSKIIDKVKKLGLEKSLEDAEILQNVSPSWKDAHSSESMILRKMINNAIRKYPKNFANSFMQTAYQETVDEQLKEAITEKDDNANNGDFVDIIDVDESEIKATSLHDDENNIEEKKSKETIKNKSKKSTQTVKKEEKVDLETGEVLENKIDLIEPIESIENENQNQNENDMETAIKLNDAYAVVSSSGSYKGKTLGEIKKENKSWFKYMDEKFPDYNTELMQAIRFIREHDSEVD